MKRIWITCNLFTIVVTVDEYGNIIEAAPIARRFKRQPLTNLLDWAEKQGGMEWRELSDAKPPFKVRASNMPEACLDKLKRWGASH